MTTNDRRILKHMMLNDGILFMRYFFKQREGIKMLLNWHHFVIERVLERVYKGEITRLIINIAPGYSKTEQVILNFMARGLAINPRSKFIHASYSGDLALHNSAKIKDTILTNEYQQLFPMEVRVDSKSKKKWFTTQGGGMMATSSGGQITGFRAGHMEPGFTGALMIDDPVKPDDAYSDVKRNRINDRFNNTMRSRLALETVPMVIIMQRIHEEDLTGYLLKGGSGDHWHHLTIPSYFGRNLNNLKYSEEYTHGIPIGIQDTLDYLQGMIYAGT